MAYSHFTFDKIRQELKLLIQDKSGLFSAIKAAPVNEYFATSLHEDNVPLGLAINTEKARSELIIAPILLELRKILHKQVSLFSGIELNVKEELGLNGVCDFIISLNPEQFFLDAPIIIIVEAKKEDLIKGLPQCIAAMWAAQLFNQARNNHIEKIYGIVTTGSTWKFIQLENQTVYIDLDEYHIKELCKIMGILLSMCLRPNLPLMDNHTSSHPP